MILKVLQIIVCNKLLSLSCIPLVDLIFTVFFCSKMSENLFALRSRLLLKMRKLFGDENVNWKAEKFSHS